MEIFAIDFFFFSRDVSITFTMSGKAERLERPANQEHI